MALEYQKHVKEIFVDLRTSEKGLPEDEAISRLDKCGPNVISEAKKQSIVLLFISQFRSPLIWVLIAAMIVSFVMKRYIDFGVIAAIVVLNAVLGFIQEYRAERAITALKKLVSLKAAVLRDGKESEIDASELVPGDIIFLSTGQIVPADARLIEVINLQAQEASLTGESLPVKKQLKVFGDFASVADRANMVFSGTSIAAGRGKAVVTDTGMNTEFGKIAQMITSAVSPETPLQVQLKTLSIFLGILVAVIAGLVFVIGLAYGNEFMAMFMSAIALAVAAIPEGLPAVVTVSLALGIQKLARKNALMRKLTSVETLGACTVICSDKTGTLTHNEMTVKKIFVNNEVVSVTGSGYSPEGAFGSNPRHFDILLRAGALNNNASVVKEGSSWKVIGDPTEAALIVSAKKAGLNLESLNAGAPRVGEIEFTSERKMMTTMHGSGERRVAYTKGAPEEVLKLCNRLLFNGQLLRLSRQDKEKILSVNNEFASQALRVLGFAFKPLKGTEALGSIEKDMIFVGLQAMIDPPRHEVKDAIDKCRNAGIKVIMVTGDHANTAKAIAKELGISGKVLTGEMLEQIDGLERFVDEVGVFARVNPADKLRIIDALKKKGHVVAMTGDGLNDAPALKKADLGIAMGTTGTDVAKEASDMVLADDNFASIVSAVEGGRAIFDNIKKFVEYLLSSNMGEVLTVFTAVLFGLPLPVVALQLLWINLVTDGAPALALGVEPPEPGIMQRAPRKSGERIVSLRCGVFILLIGLIMMAGTLAVFEIGKPEIDLTYARTMAFTALMMFQMFNVLNQRSESKSLFKIGLFSNRWLWLAIIVSVGLQMLVVYLPFFNSVFSTVPLNMIDWVWIVLISASVLVFGEIVKFLKL